MYYFNAPGKDKAHPMNKLVKELFTPEDQNNKNTTPILEELVVVMAEAWIAKMVDPHLVTWNIFSEPGEGYLGKDPSDKFKISGWYNDGQ